MRYSKPKFGRSKDQTNFFHVVLLGSCHRPHWLSLLFLSFSLFQERRASLWEKPDALASSTIHISNGALQISIRGNKNVARNHPMPRIDNLASFRPRIILYYQPTPRPAMVHNYSQPRLHQCVVHSVRCGVEAYRKPGNFQHHRGRSLDERKSLTFYLRVLGTMLGERFTLLRSILDPVPQSVKHLPFSLFISTLLPMRCISYIFSESPSIPQRSLVSWAQLNTVAPQQVLTPLGVSGKHAHQRL